jgi:uncharacterized protein (DUF2235 family)
MMVKGIGHNLINWLQNRLGQAGHSALTARRGPVDHVIILDGTMSSLERGCETNAGLAYRLLCEQGHSSLFYEAGLQWTDWASTRDIIVGRGINRQIQRAYGFLASRYRPGDRIVLLGYSRGAFAVRSLAGVIDRIGLLKPNHATERNIRQIYRLYQYSPDSTAAAHVARTQCHDHVSVEMIGVWDTVKALGLRLPVIWRFQENQHDFHNHELGPCVKHGYHALAYDERRRAFEPVLWATPKGDWEGRVEQVWFRGTHPDVGGQLGGHHATRPLSNIPLVWMLSKLEGIGIDLPVGWRSRFPTDVDAPRLALWSGLGKLFLVRRRRQIGHDPSEQLHPSLERFLKQRPKARRRVQLPDK